MKNTEQKALHKLTKLDKVPSDVSRLTNVPNVSISLSEIELFWNSVTQHAFIENLLPLDYYEDYLMTTSYSKSILDLQKNQIEKFFAFTKVEGSRFNSIVEVGCGDGVFLSNLKSKVSRCVGIEPSRKFATVARSNGLEIIEGYVNEKDLLTDEKFDAFVSRQVFEHLKDPIDVLKGIKKMLNPGALGLIEVPNGYKALRKGRFYEFFPDHLNYFSVNSLVDMASQAGLNVIECREVFGGDYLELWLRNSIDEVGLNASIMVSKREQLSNDVLSILKDSKSKNKKVGIWGCGAKTQSIVASLSTELNDYVPIVIDRDPNKHDLFIPNTMIKVISPELITTHSIEIIIVLALSYIQEIIYEINALLPGKKIEIFTFAHEGNGELVKIQ